jgi:hypothetical protein
MSASLYFKSPVANDYLTIINDQGEEMDLNMSNTNARHFLREIGLENIDIDDCQMISIGLFFNKCLDYCNLKDRNSGRATVTHFGIVGQSPTIIECGVAEEYVYLRAMYAMRMCKIARLHGCKEIYFA